MGDGITFVVPLHMKKKFNFVPLFGVIILGFGLLSFNQKEIVNFSQKVENKAFQSGEVLNYRIHYGVVNAGIVTMKVSEPVKVNDRDAYNLKIEGETLKSFDWAYKVRDKFETWIDVESHVPYRYSKTVRENDYFYQEIAIYNHEQKYLKNKKGKITITPTTMDVASAIYYLRNIDYNNSKVGAKFPMDVYIDNEVYNLSVKYVGKETIATPLGKIRCIKIKPELVVDRVFKNKDAMTVWVSDDDNHIPVRIQTEIYVGSLKVDLVKHENLKNPLSALIKK